MAPTPRRALADRRPAARDGVLCSTSDGAPATEGLWPKVRVRIALFVPSKLTPRAAKMAGMSFAIALTDEQ
jgi:hypothetical protein